MPDYDSRNIPILDDVIDDDITEDDKIIDLSNLTSDQDDDDSFDLFAEDLTESEDDSQSPTAENLFTLNEDSDSRGPDIGNIDEFESQNENTTFTDFSFTPSAEETHHTEIDEDSGSLSGNDIRFNENITIDIPLGETDEDEISSFFANNDSDGDGDGDNYGNEADATEIKSALIGYVADEKDDLSTFEAETLAASWHNETNETLENTTSQSSEALSAEIREETDTAINKDDLMPAPKPQISLEAVTEDIIKQIMPTLEQQLRILVQQALEEKLSALLTAQSINKQD